MALGALTAFLSCFGLIPGPIIMGAIIGGYSHRIHPSLAYSPPGLITDRPFRQRVAHYCACPPFTQDLIHVCLFFGNKTCLTSLSLLLSNKTYLTLLPSSIYRKDSSHIYVSPQSTISSMRFTHLPFHSSVISFVDNACLIWDYTCGERGNCWLYDTDYFRVAMHAVPAGTMPRHG